MSPPVGPTGLPEQCDGAGPPTWQVTGAVDTMATTIVFGSGLSLRETTASATLGHFAASRFGWSATAGGVIAGSIEGRPIHGGVTLAGGVTWLALYERARRPFVAVSGSVGTALIRGTADDASARTWFAWDVRGGAMVGKTWWRLVPYAAARVFGGPVFWYRGGDAVVGSDRYHVTAGVGVTARLPARIDATIEVMPLGEQSATGAATLHF